MLNIISYYENAYRMVTIKKKTQKITNTGKDIEKSVTLYIALEM